MDRSNSTRLATFARIIRLSLIPSAITTLVILVGGMLYLKQSSIDARELLRSDVQRALDVVAVRLESNVEKLTSAVSTLGTIAGINPNLLSEGFASLASATMHENPGILRISLAPDGVISDVVPREEKARRVGRRLDRFYAQRTASNWARALKKPVIGSHVRLADGTYGFDAYVPITVTTKGVETFWGYLELLIADKAIYRDTVGYQQNLSERGRILVTNLPEAPYAISIRDMSIQARNAEPFLGVKKDFESDAVLRKVNIAGALWQLAGVPKAGWNQPPAHGTLTKTIILLGALIANVPILFTGWMMNARQVALVALDQRNKELLTMSHRLNLALESSRFAVWEIDIDTGTRFWDEWMYELHGLPYDPSSPTANGPGADAWKTNIHPDDLEQAEHALQQTLDSLGVYGDEYRIIDKGKTRYLRHAGLFHQASDGQRKVTGISWDITDDVERTAALTAAKDRIEHNAFHDPLTELGNRRMLDRTLTGLLQRAPDGTGNAAPAIALLHLDLDRFKQINDTLGHAAGDAMLVHAARILKAHTGPDDTVARIGGDEFVIVTAETDEAKLTALSQGIIDAMHQPVDHEGTACRFGVSVGIAISDTATDARALLVNADIALYRAKENGRNRHVFFTETLQSDIVETKRIGDEILAGIENDEFTAWYQPQFDAKTMTLCGVEALIRWEHPRDGILPPATFLSIAKDLNVVAALDAIVLRKALVDMARWTAAGLVVPKVSVNVSAKRLRDPMLTETLTGLSFTQGRLCFELVESIFLDGDDDILMQNIAAIKALGIEIDIDDFGTGHTSVVGLLKIKPNRLKIDRQLVSPMTTSVREQALVRAIIEIGHSLGIETVAEGVDTLAHVDMLATLGCDALQGYALSKPLSAAEFARFAHSESGFRTEAMLPAEFGMPLAS
ncbi:EAL domain-containing protein [Rhizobium sp. YIM 134829]|uniref:bifunctional diguanylate cyclase/phosphodiesterase n=1 Tax=Rhizobium sp. YIM 134829 TaxID=3390453 RepID=UPI00397ABA01